MKMAEFTSYKTPNSKLENWSTFIFERQWP